MQFHSTVRLLLVQAAIGVVATLLLAQPARAATISWKGHTWNVTNGGMAGVCQGSTANVSIDASGFLHMKISKNGSTWTAAEIFSTDKIGFGTYQWQIEGPTDKLDKNVVVGLFPYGPEAGLGESGNNEIDIEFARWGNAAWPNGNYTIWPPTGSTTGEHTFSFSLDGGTSLTTRFTWSSTKIDFATLSGFVAVDAASGVIDTWSFAPANPTTRITQEAMPLGMNLWCYDNPPSDGQNVELIVRDFQFVPLGSPLDGGAGGAAGAGGAGGRSGSGGAGGRDGSAGADASGNKGGAIGAGGAAGAGGTGAGGTVGSGGAGAGGAVGSGGVGTAGAAGSRGSGTGGIVGTGGLVGTGGAGSGGATSSGAGGAMSSGGSAGSAAAAGGAGEAGSSGAAGSAGNGAGGGPSGAGGTSSTTVAGAKDAGGCGCGIGSARSMRGARAVFIAVAVLLACRYRRRRPVLR
jgi:hypothetical protein